MSWTDERIATLKKMWEGGATASQIADELGGVSRNAVIGKAHRLGLKSRPSPVKASEQSKASANKPAAKAAVAKKPAAKPAKEETDSEATPAAVATEADGLVGRLQPRATGARVHAQTHHRAHVTAAGSLQ